MLSGFSADPPQPLTAPLPAISELKNFLCAELASFKDELERHNDESINFAVKKIRLENFARHKFKYKGNEEQYQHQEKVASHIDSAVVALHSGKLVEAANALEEGKNAIAIRMKHMVLVDLHGWDFVTEYKQIPVAEDEAGEKLIRKILKEVGNLREKKKAERAKKANKLRPDFRRVSTRFTNASSAFTPLSTCFLCNRPGHFWRSCWRSKYPTASASNNALSWQRNLVQLPAQSTYVPPPSQGTAK